MPARSHAWPRGHWDWYQHLAFKHGIRAGELIFVGGQVDKNERGDALHPHDLATQTAVAVRHIDTVLREFGAALADVTRLVAFYADDGRADADAFVADVGRHVQALGGAPDGVGPAITPVPLPWLALPGMVVEIEAVARFGRDGQRLPRRAANPPGLPPLPAPFSHGLRSGEHVWVSAQSGRAADGGAAGGDLAAATGRAIERVGRVLAELGADLEDTVKLNTYFAGDGTRATWEPVARERARRLGAPGPAATDLPTPRLGPRDGVRVGAWAMRPEGGARLSRRHAGAGAWRWPIALASPMGLRCGDLAFVGGQLPLDGEGRVADRTDLVGQTRRVMEATRAVLAELGLQLDDMVQQTSFYYGESRPEVIVQNQRLRSSYYTEPAGASTGVPLTRFALEDVLVTIETIAMARD
jgi:enamine deaminase RidA (YjgF/YER057c/UK114 family)